jgi:hypothetical protein
MAKSKKPKAFDVAFSDSERKNFTNDLCLDIQNALMARQSVIGDGGLIDYADWFYEQGRSAAEDLPFPGAADLTSYFITENVDALRSRLMKAVFGVRPFSFVEGWGADAKKAPVVEAFLDWQVRKPFSEFKTELAKTIHGALIEDGYILEVSEQTETTKRTEQLDVALELAPHPDTGEPVPILGPDGHPKIQQDPQTGEPVVAQAGQPKATIERTQTKTKRLGPQYDPISLKDFVFLPGHAKSSKRVYGYAYRIFLRQSDVDERVLDGVYDAEAVKTLGTNSDRETHTIPVPVDTIADQYGPNVEKEFWQVSIKRDLDEDGREEWYLATVSLKERLLLRLKLDLFVQKVGMPRCVPFILFPRRDSIYGYSYAFSKLMTLAEEHTSLRNMKADRGALATNAPMTQLTGGLWDPTVQPFGVGRVITVRDHNELKQLQIADVPVSIVEQEHALLSAKERVGGLSDAAVGVLSSERRTLGENKLVAGGSAVRVDEVIGHLHLAIARVMALTHAIWVETLEAEKQGIDAPQSIANSLKASMPEFSGTFTADMLKGDFQFEPYGSDDTADRDRQRQEGDSFILALTNLAKVLPGFQPLMVSPEVTKAILEHLLRAYDVRDKQPFLGALQAPGLPPQMGAGMSPSPAGMPSETPPAGPPDIGALLAHLAGGGTITGNDQPAGTY